MHIIGSTTINLTKILNIIYIKVHEIVEKTPQQNKDINFPTLSKIIYPWISTKIMLDEEE
jgi:hypothetical protein